MRQTLAPSNGFVTGLISACLLIGTVVSASSADPSSVQRSLSPASVGDGAMPDDTEAAARTISKVEVLPSENAVSIAVSGDGRFTYTTQMVDEHRLVIDFQGVASAITRSRINGAHRLLKQVRIGSHDDKVRLVLDLPNPVHYEIRAQRDQLIATLTQRDSESSRAADIPASDDMMLSQYHRASDHRMPTVRPVSRQVPLALARSGYPNWKSRTVQIAETDSPGKEASEAEIVVPKKRYVGRRISLDFQQADISNVLRLIAEVSGFNIVVGEGVKSKVTMKLVSVPWDQALDMLLKMNGLGMIKQGNIVWVDTLGNIAKQQDDEARAKEAKSKAEEMGDQVFYIRNINAQMLQTSLRPYIGPRGRMQFNQESNALIVRDTISNLAVMKQLVEGLDLEVPQVQIEARIVQADTTYSRSLGVQWGIQNVNTMSPAFGVANFKTGTVGPFGAQTSDFLINLPAAVSGLTSTPGLGFTFGRVDGALLDVRLSAGELLGLTKIIAAPKITTLDKRDAKISQGESIPFQTTSLQGTQTTFVDANLELNVTPQITSRDPNEVGKLILMKVRATRNAVGVRSNPAGPSIDRREANTQVKIRDGETMVIGGVFVDTQSNTVSGVPYLSRVPVLGWLFKNKSESVAKQELLIFLTPTIVKS